MSSEKKLREVVKKLIKEEISSSGRSRIKDELCEVIEAAVDKVLVENGVHKKGLSEQQCSHLFKCVVDTVDSKLNEFTTKQKPKEFDNYEEIIKRYNI